MAAYIIVDVDVRDPETYAEYIKLVPPTISSFGGKFLVRGGKAANLEGEWQPKRVVVLEFPTLDNANRWWASEEYREPKALRQSASVANIIVVDGV